MDTGMNELQENGNYFAGCNETITVFMVLHKIWRLFSVAISISRKFMMKAFLCLQL